MADIQFNEDQEYQRSAIVERKSLFVRLVLATGIVSSDKAAEYVLICFVILGLGITFFSFTRSGPASPPPATQIIWVAGPGAIPGKR
ncbi:MAG: hypothetical protein WCW36_03630 [Candidatus Paceibacterota bacterium]|jgi:hypothetical protein